MTERSHAITVARRRGAAGLLFAITLLGVFPLDVLLPSFAAMAAHFQRTPADISLSVSLFALGIAFSQLLIGPLSDVIGRKGLLMSGMTVAMFGAIGCALTDDYTFFLIFRVVQAVGCGCFVLSQALLQDLFEYEERNRLRILLVTAGGLFISVSPLAGSVLQATLGWRANFWGFAMLAAVVMVGAWRLLDNTRPATSVGRVNFIHAYGRVLSNFDFVSYWLISAFAFACHFSFIVISPLIFMDQLQLPAYEFSLILLLYGVAYIIGGIVATVLSRRIAPGRQILIGLGLILLAGLVMLYLSAHFTLAPATVLLPMLICTAGTTISRPIVTSRVMNMFPDNAGTAAAAGTLLIFICGGLISALISLSTANLQSTLGYSFVILSSMALLLNRRVNRRVKRLDVIPS